MDFSSSSVRKTGLLKNFSELGYTLTISVKQVQQIIDNCIVLLRCRLAELGIEVETPAELLNKAKEIVSRHKELQSQMADLQNQVNLHYFR